MLKYLGMATEAKRVEAAVTAVLAQKESLTPDLGGRSGTREMALAIVQAMR